MRTIQVAFPLVLFNSSEPVANCPNRLRQSVWLKFNVKMSCFSPLDEHMSKWINEKRKKKKLLCDYFHFLFTCTILCQVQMRVSVFWVGFGCATISTLFLCMAYKSSAILISIIIYKNSHILKVQNTDCFNTFQNKRTAGRLSLFPRSAVWAWSEMFSLCGHGLIPRLTVGSCCSPWLEVLLRGGSVRE